MACAGLGLTWQGGLRRMGWGCARRPQKPMATAIDPVEPNLEAAVAAALAGRRVRYRRGRKTVAVVPEHDLDLLRKLEDLLDAELAREALAEASVEGTVSLEALRDELGL